MYRQTFGKTLRLLRKTVGFGAFIFLTFLLMAGACGGNPPQGPSLSVSPPNLAASIGSGAQTFTATLTNSTDTITWSLTGAGSISATTGATTSYTPPATGSASTATLTATAGSLTSSATITITAAAASLTISPSSANTTVGSTPVPFTATLVGSTDTITWTLSGSAGSISDATGATTTYTPPATGSATIATLTATAGSLSDSATITVNAQATLTVVGKVLNFDGSAAAGVNVQIDDSAGATSNTSSIGDGSFTIANVKTPYTLSVIPNDGINAPQSWTGVTLDDPTAVINPLAGPSAFCTSPAPGTLNVNFPAVGAGNTAAIAYVAPGINQFEALSNAQNTAVAGDTTTTLTVNFDTSLCQTTVSGKVLYFELDGTNVPVKTASVNATVITGNTQTVNITPQTANTQSLGGTITFPTGTTTTNVNLIAKVGDASIILGGLVQTITNVLPTYEFAAPVIPGVQYYTLASGNNNAGNTFQWSTSEAISTLPAVADLTLPNSVQTVQPSGAIGTNPTPTFSYTAVTGANLYSTQVLDQLTGGTVTTWLGQTSGTSLKVPSLPAPARLDVGTEAVPKAFIWFVNAIKVRAGGDSDTMLDGRQVKKFYIGAGLGDFFGILNPDVISSGSVNLVTTTFTLP